MSAPLLDLESEKTLCGAPLVHPKVMVDLGSLKAEHFYLPWHQAIWQAVKQLDTAQQPIDTLTVTDAMKVAGTFDLLAPRGGVDYFHELTGAVVTLENLGHHAKRLKELARRRSWLVFAKKMAVEAGDDGIGTEEFNDQAERSALAMTVDLLPEGGPRHVAAVLKDYRHTLDRRQANRTEGGVSGVPSGSRRMDHMTLGFQPGDLVVIAARPSMGKTALVCNIVANAVEQKFPCLVFSFEMADQQLVERMVSRESGVLARTLRTGQLDQTDWMAMTRTMSNMSVRPLELDDRGGIDIHEIRTTARQWWARQKGAEMGLVVLDYMQLIGDSPTQNKNMTREREVALQSRALKQLAKELKCPVIALAQLSRSLESRADKRPMMSDLRESGAIEQDADTIAFIYREVVYDKNVDDKEAAEIIFAKQRNGITGTVHMRFDGMLQRFTDAPHDPTKGD